MFKYMHPHRRAREAVVLVVKEVIDTSEFCLLDLVAPASGKVQPPTILNLTSRIDCKKGQSQVIEAAPTQHIISKGTSGSSCIDAALHSHTVIIPPNALGLAVNKTTFRRMATAIALSLPTPGRRNVTSQWPTWLDIAKSSSQKQ